MFFEATFPSDRYFLVADFSRFATRLSNCDLGPYSQSSRTGVRPKCWLQSRRRQFFGILEDIAVAKTGCKTGEICNYLRHVAKCFATSQTVIYRQKLYTRALFRAFRLWFNFKLHLFDFVSIFLSALWSWLIIVLYETPNNAKIARYKKVENVYRL